MCQHSRLLLSTALKMELQPTSFCEKEEKNQAIHNSKVWKSYKQFISKMIKKTLSALFGVKLQSWPALEKNP